MSNKWFSSFLSLGNFLVATCVTYLLSLIVSIENVNAKVDLNLNFVNDDFALSLFCFGIVFIIINWIIYEIRFNALDTDGNVTYYELFSFLLILLSIILLTAGFVWLIDPTSAVNNYGYRWNIFCIGIGLILQPIADGIIMLKNIKNKDRKDIIFDVLDSNDPILSISIRFFIRIILAFFIVTLTFGTKILRDNNPFSLTVDENMFINCILFATIAITLIWNLYILTAIIKISLKLNPEISN